MQTLTGSSCLFCNLFLNTLSFHCGILLLVVSTQRETVNLRLLLLRRKAMMSSPQTVVWNRPCLPEERLPHPLMEGKSSSSSSSNQSEQGFTRTGSSPLAVPGRRSVRPSSCTGFFGEFTRLTLTLLKGVLVFEIHEFNCIIVIVLQT